MRELGERGGLGRDGETQNVEREKIELGEGRKERERKKKGKKQYFAENHGMIVKIFEQVCLIFCFLLLFWLTRVLFK